MLPYSKNSLSLGTRFKTLTSIGLSATLLAGSMLAQAAVVTLGDGSEYEINLDSHIGNTWTYSVTELSGRSLSHWNVGIPACIEHIVDYSPSDGYDTTDGSTPFEGIKWDVEEDFTSGTFSFTLDDDYPETIIEVQAKAGTTGNERTAEVVGPECEPPPCDYIYGVHDDGLNNSHIFRVHPVTLKFEDLGSPCMGCDIEGLDISPSGELFGSAGDDTDMPGALYKINMVTGVRTMVGSPSGLEIDGISFNPVDGLLFGWAQNEGLLSINTGSGVATVLDSEEDIKALLEERKGLVEIEDLTSSNDGGTYYFILNNHPIGIDPDASKDDGVGQKLMSYDGGEPVNVCDISGEIEALEVLQDGKLLVGYHDKGGQLAKVVDPVSCAESVYNVPVPYTDIEGLAVCPPVLP